MLAVLAGVHGDEYEGPVAIADLLAALDPAALAGTLIALPVANPPAFAAGTRTSPLDGLNLARCFDGDPRRLGEPTPGLDDRRGGDRRRRRADRPAQRRRGLRDGDAGRLLRPGRRGRATVARPGPRLRRTDPLGAPGIRPGRTLSAALDRGIPCVYTEAAGGGAAPGRCRPVLYRRGAARDDRARHAPRRSPRPRHGQFWRGSGNTDRGWRRRRAASSAAPSGRRRLSAPGSCSARSSAMTGKRCRVGRGPGGGCRGDGPARAARGGRRWPLPADHPCRHRVARRGETIVRLTSRIYLVGSGEIGLSDPDDCHVYLLDGGRSTP